jgi:hypothetical protein
LKESLASQNNVTGTLMAHEKLKLRVLIFIVILAITFFQFISYQWWLFASTRVKEGADARWNDHAWGSKNSFNISVGKIR